MARVQCSQHLSNEIFSLGKNTNPQTASSGQVLFRLTAVLATRQTPTNASCVNIQYWTKKTQPNIKCYLTSCAQNLVLKFSGTWKFLMHLIPIIKNCIEILCNINFAENIWSQKLASTFRLQVIFRGNIWYSAINFRLNILEILDHISELKKTFAYLW